MKIRLNSAIRALSAFMAAGLLAGAVRAQQNVAGHANNFSSVEYFEPPHQQQMKSRLSGAEARPQAGGLLLIKDLKLEIFDTNGVPEVVIRAPHCVYDTQNGVANSPGHLRLETGDGSSHVEGDGFLWRQSSSLLTISNNVRTVIENTSETKAGL
ncbi:MAG: hypothetical protein PHY43_03380 [Verrucomicrobiales bacterium]|nr:hypothetical protein [Verrucomicrobiales bacterium]